MTEAATTERPAAKAKKPPVKRQRHIAPGDLEQERLEASAVIPVGAEVDIWGHLNGHLGTGTIAYPYGVWKVISEDGPYFDADGGFNMQPGYPVRLEDGKVEFFKACRLSPVGEKYGHLKLVKK